MGILLVEVMGERGQVAAATRPALEMILLKI
jgi:hypothetical protein